MKFRGHETFYIRKGWLYKGLKYINVDPSIFVNKEENPMDKLGIGSNMVKSLRYWLQATNLTEEPDKGRKEQTMTPFGEVVYTNDPFLEEVGTISLIHYKLASNKDLATSWYYFFNVFTFQEFIKEDFLNSISKYLTNEGEKIPSLRSLDDDFNCIMNMYVDKKNIHSDKIDPENNLDSPLGELGLVEVVRKNSYRKNAINTNLLSPFIALAIIVDNIEDSREIQIHSIENDKGNLGQIFNLDPISLMDILFKIEKSGLIKVIRTAGLDVVKVDEEISFLDCCNMYYKDLNYQD